MLGNGVGLPIWGGIVDIYHVIVLMVSSNMTQVSHRCGGIERSYEAEKFSIYRYMENGHIGHNVSNISIIHKIQSLDVGFHIC